MTKAGTNQKKSLESFIKDRHQVLTVLGVLFALVGFFTSRGEPYRSLTKFIATSILIMAVIVFLEIWSKFPKFSNQEIRLTLFRVFYAISFVTLFVWFILDYRAFIRQEPALASVVLVILFFFLMATLLSGFPELIGPFIWRLLDKTGLGEKPKDFIAVISFLLYAAISAAASLLWVGLIYTVLTASWW
jgi:hypothetical protein